MSSFTSKSHQIPPLWQIYQHLHKIISSSASHCIDDRVMVRIQDECIFNKFLPVTTVQKVTFWAQQQPAHHIPACSGWISLDQCTASYDIYDTWSALPSGAVLRSFHHQIHGCNTWGKRKHMHIITIRRIDHFQSGNMSLTFTEVY